MADANLKDVIVEITSKRLGVTAVTDVENNLHGIITDGDLRRMLEKSENLTTIKAKDIASFSPKTISADALAIQAFEVFKTYDITHLLVVKNQQYLGVLHLHDLVREGIL